MRFTDLDPNVVIWLIIAVINILPATVAAVYSIRTRNTALKGQELSRLNSEALRENTALTKTVEIATNSMKDALVAASKSAALAEGREIGRAEGAAKAASLAEGRLAAQEKLPDQ